MKLLTHFYSLTFFSFAALVLPHALFAQDSTPTQATNTETVNTDIFAQGPVVVFETTQGIIELELYPTIAPKATENFLGLVEKGYYNGIIFHRVIKGFMIQGGDPSGTGAGGESLWGKPFEDEVNEYMTFSGPGILAMANRGPSTNGSQFFITTAATPHLNMRHTIFGFVKSGYEVVRKIETTQTGAGDRPVTDQVIQRAYIKSK
jgi:peptidylprolyl isomerase